MLLRLTTRVRPKLQRSNTYEQAYEHFGLERVTEKLTSYDHFGGDKDLDDAILDCERAIGLLLPSVLFDTVQTAKWSILMATALRLRFERDCVLKDIEDARQLLETLTASAVTGSTIHTRALYGLGRIYEALYHHKGAQEFADHAYTCYRQAATQESENADGKDVIGEELLIHLGWSLNSRLAPDTMAEAISILSSVLEDTIDTSPLHTLALHGLSGVHYGRWNLDGRIDRADLIRSEDYARRASMNPHRLRFRHMQWLVTLLRERYESGDEVILLHEGIELGKQAFDLVTDRPASHDVATILIALGLTHYSRFKAEGQLEDVDNAIELHRRALRTIESAPPTIYHSLVDFLCARYEEIGMLRDIDDAIELGQQATEGAPYGHPYALITKANLGRAHALRYIYQRDDSDFNGAKTYLNEACYLCEDKDTVSVPPGLRAYCLEMLSRLHGVHFQLRRELTDVELAVTFMRAATDLRADDDLALPSLLSELGGYLSVRFQIYAAQSDLLDALAFHKAALELASPAYVDRTMILWRYAYTLRLRSQQTYDLEPTFESIRACEEAVAQAQEQVSPKVTLFMTELAAALTARFLNLRQPEDLVMALSCYLTGAKYPGGFTQERLRAAVLGARLAQEHGQLPKTIELYSVAVGLLPRIAWLGFQEATRHAQLNTTAIQLTCDAGGCAVLLGQFERAVELVDGGRTSVWRSLLGMHQDLDDLRATAPELSEKLVFAGTYLEHDDKTGTTGLSEQHAQTRYAFRRQIASLWETSIDEVRTVKGMKSFLSTPGSFELRKAAREGPVILLNCSAEFGSEALIITLSDPIRRVPLPALTQIALEQLHDTLRCALQVPRDAEGCRFLDRVLVDVGRRLWHGGVKGIATALRFGSSRPASAKAFRVWWVPAGKMAGLPVHLAGPYRAPEKGMSDLFISSYVGTLSALIASRDRQALVRVPPPSPRRIVVLTCDTTSKNGRPFIDENDREVQAIREVATSTGGRSIEVKYKKEEVKAAMKVQGPSQPWLHLTCPVKWDGTRCYVDAESTHGDLSMEQVVRFTHSEFAFISSPNERPSAITATPHEPIPLATALHISTAVSCLVAPMWPIAEQDGPRMAGLFYRKVGGSGQRPKVRDTAEGIWEAAAELKRAGVGISRWGTWVHTGV